MAPMDYGFAKTMTEEEQNRYEEFRGRVLSNSQGGMSADQNGGGYYAGYMDEEQGTGPAVQSPGAVQSQEPAASVQEPQYSKLWLADPVNFTAIEDKYKDPNYVDEHWTREQIDSLGKYFNAVNYGKTRDQWEKLKDDDEFVTKIMMNSAEPWWDPGVEEQQNAAQTGQSIDKYYTPQNEREERFLTERESKSWDDLKWWQKGYYAFFPGQQGGSLAGAPEYTKKTQDMGTAIQNAGAGAAALKIVGIGAGMLGGEAVAAALTNPWVLLGGALVYGGLTYYQIRTGNELPIVNKIGEIVDIGDTVTKRALGSLIQTGDIASEYIKKANADPNDAYGLLAAVNDAIKEAYDYRNEIWKTGEYTYSMYGGIGDILSDAANFLFEGGDITGGTKLGEAWMFNKGYSEKVQLEEGTYGYEGMQTIRELYRNMKESGLDDAVIDSLIQYYVNEQSGFSGVEGNFWGESLMDLSALAPGFENSAISSLAKITGNDTMSQAAEVTRATRPLINDMPVIGTIYNSLTGEKPSGGFNETIEVAKNLVRGKDVSQLTAFDRMIAGLDDEGRIKQLTPHERQGLTDFLPETQVLGADKIAMDIINSGMSEAQDEAQVHAVLDNYVNGAEGLYNSPDVVTTRDAVAAGMPKTEVYFQRYRDGTEGRAYLKTVAEALGMEQKDVITMVTEKPEVLTQRMQDTAAKNNGKIGTIDAANIDNTITILKGFTGKDPLLWNLNQLKALATGALFDEMNKYNIEKYGVKPDAFIVQMADTMKASQSLMLLGLNPGYMINNVMNNTVTAIAEGVFGLMTPKQMQSIFDEMGVVPARLGETLSEMRGMNGSMSSLDAMNQRIADAKRTKGLLSDVRSAIRKANNKLGVFSNISGKFEELQGKQVTATAINQYWRQTWKAGTGFRAMPEALVNRIEAQTPGMTNMIYMAVERGLNMNDVTRSLYGSYIHADVANVLRNTISEAYPGVPYLYDELFVKSGLLNEIEAAYAMANTEAERAAALDGIRTRTREFVNNLKRNETINKAESIRNIVDTEGINAVQNIMADMAINRAETWLLSRDEYNEAYKTIAADKLSGSARSSLLSAVNAKNRADWAKQYSYELQVMKGVMDGLGFETETNARYISAMIQMNDSWQEFYQKKEQMIKEVFAEIDRREAAMNSTDIKSGAASVMRDEVWQRFYDETSAMYKEYFRKEMDFQRQMDDLLVSGFEKATGKSGAELAQNLANMRDIRQLMSTMQQDAHDRTRNMTDKEKAKFYAEFDPKYNKLIVDLEQLQKANSTIIDSQEGVGYTDNDGVKMTPGETVKARETVEAANMSREQEIRERIGYMSREEIRQGWINAGITERMSDNMMVLYDSIANTWAKLNGKTVEDYYSEAAELRDLLKWAGIVDGNLLTQADHKQMQFEIINENNPMRNDYHAGIRSVDDVLTFQEAVEADRRSGKIGIYKDWDKKKIRNAIETGHITVYSSKPIENGVFVTPSKMMAQNYADGENAKIYSKTVDLTSVAWINSSEGGYAQVSRFDSDYINQSKEAYYKNRILEHWLLGTFKNWFDGSVVKEPDGYPIIVHHGTPYEFEIFKKKLMGSASGLREARMGIFFSQNEENTKKYKNLKAINSFRDLLSYDPGLELSDIDISRAEKIIAEYRKWQDIINHSNLKQYFEMEPDYFRSTDEYVNEIRAYQESGNENRLQQTLLEMEESTDRFVNAYMNLEDIMKAEGRDVAVYLQIRKPLDVKDFQTDGRKIVDIVQEAKSHPELYDGAIIRNIPMENGGSDTYYVVFEPTQIKGIENDGTFGTKDPNYLKQKAAEAAKGTFDHTDAGNIIRMLEASDVSTMVHESGHLFRRTLNDQNMKDFTQWAGFQSVTEFQELEARYWSNDPTLSDTDRQRYVDAEEKFARGFEQYLIDGSAPTTGLKAVFQEFSKFLLSIYQGIKNLAVKDYSGQGEFVFDGPNGREVLNINAEINGVKLRDIFDRMLADGEINRVPGYREAVLQQVSDMRSQRLRMNKEAQYRRAQAEINQRVLSNWNSLAEAEGFLQTMKAPVEIDGLAVDDVFLYQVIESAKADPQMNPFSGTEFHTVTGTQTYGYSNTDPNKKYQFRYKVVELYDLQPSNNWMGSSLPVNENYPAELQPRSRDTVQSRNQIYNIASNLNPGKIVDDQKSISSGAPTIGEGNMYVEAGNGRVLSLQYAQQNFPDSWQNYQEYLRSTIGEYGINPAELDGFENPVLVRERMGGDATAFIMDANSRDTLDYSASESAINDANNINMNTLGSLDIQPGEGIDTFTTEKNARAATEWLRSLPENERAAYMTTNRVGDMVLTMDGKNRFINALFASLYATSENLDIIKSFAETSDSNIQALESAMKATLPEMARAEGLIRSGDRNANFSIVNDVVVAAGLLQEARKANQNIHDYLAQSTIPGLERWTPTQALLAGFFGDAKNNVRMLRDFFNVYGEEVFKSEDPDQVSLLPDSKTKEQIIDTAIKAALDNKAKEVMKGTAANQVSGNNGQNTGLNQSIETSLMDEFNNTIHSNLQETFDSGMAVTLDQAEQIKLKGEPDTKYRERFEAKLDEISQENDYGMTARTFAGQYMEWILSDKKGEEPHSSNPIVEDNVKYDIDDLFSWGGTDLEQLHELHKPGCEVDDTAVPNKGIYVKRVYEFQHGDYTIAANVYVDGEFYGYLPDDLSKMDRTIEENGIRYKVLAIDPNDPRGLVYDDTMAEEVKTVIPGQVDGIEGPEAPKEFIRGSKQGTTPDIMPTGTSYEELYNKYLEPVLQKFKGTYETAETDARTMNFNGLDLETRALIEKWLDNNVKEDMAENKYRAIKYSDIKKDAAMLNYNQRYGFDPIMTILSPYQFWYTRSMWKWAQRMIDKPRWKQMYSRMEELEEKNKQEVLPSRLENKYRIPMPFLPDWTGGGYYVDLNSQLFPFSQFGESYGSKMNQAVLNARTGEILDELVDTNMITAEQRQEAKEKKEGTVWENAYAQAKLELNSNEAKNTLISQIYSPNIFITWYNKVRAGEDPGRLGSTRTGNALKTLTSGTGLESIGGAIGDAMTMPERALRKLYGIEYDEFGAYGDQQIRKQIAQMSADGEISDTDALNAMTEKSGTIWDIAADRQRRENELRVPLFASAEAFKSFTKGEAGIGDLAGALFASMLGGQLFPSGERKLREDKASKDQMYIDVANGDREAKSRWYDEHPEYNTYSAVYMADPEDLLKYTLYQNITKNYYAEPYERQRDIANQMGPEFRAAILNKETRNYKAVPVETLARWNGQLGGTNPNVGSIDIKGIERVMRMSDQAVDAVKEYNDTINTKYANAKIYESIYYQLPVDQRKSFLAEFPELKDYWNYKDEAKTAHPEIQRWIDDRSHAFDEDTCYNSFAAMSEYTRKELEYSKTTGKALSETADYELKRLYTKNADPAFMSYEEYIKLLKNYK